MPTDSKIEEVVDFTKIKIKTTTRQDVEDFEANENLRSYRKEHVDGVYTIVEETYPDVSGAPSENSWSFDATTSTEPLESHYIFAKNVPSQIQTYWLAWKRNPMDPSLAQALTQSESSYWNPAVDGVKNANFSVFYDRWRIGFDSFLSPRIMVRRTVVQISEPDLTNVGTLVGSLGGDCPATFPDGVEFIISAMRVQQEGDFWRITYEYLGSNPHVGWFDGSTFAPGWDNVVYQYAHL